MHIETFVIVICRRVSFVLLSLLLRNRKTTLAYYYVY